MSPFNHHLTLAVQEFVPTNLVADSCSPETTFLSFQVYFLLAVIYWNSILVLLNVHSNSNVVQRHPKVFNADNEASAHTRNVGPIRWEWFGNAVGTRSIDDGLLWLSTPLAESVF